MSDEGFCSLISDLEDEVDDDDELGSFAALGEIARRAPNAELRDALLKFASIAEEVDGLDENDPAAMGILFGLMLDPEVEAASETIERYMTEECGLDPDFDDDDLDLVDGASSDATMGSGSAMDDLNAGELREAMVSAVDQYAPGGAGGSGAGIYPSDGVTVVEFTVGQADEVDGVALCEALADLVESQTDDPNVLIKIKGSLGNIAERSPGGDCTAR